MSYLVLARRYRPQTFEQVIEQEHVTRTLGNAIAADRVAHAFLFAGPRGTGKTTIARIMAKAVNCQQGPVATPCNRCRSCEEITAGKAVDVYEIDGASNNGVDQIRELRENVKYLPAHSRYKIYIIDEVHMLSIAAFNALLKTLEEPPEHILFMFATTEPHKIPVTILSRCQRHDLRRIPTGAIQAYLVSVCQQEGRDVPEESLDLIAREANGSVRDALSLLDQILSGTSGAVTQPQVLEILGAIDRNLLLRFSRAIMDRDIALALSTVENAYQQGQNLTLVYAALLTHFRDLRVVKLGQEMDALIDLPPSDIEQLRHHAQGVAASQIHQIFEVLFFNHAAVKLASHPRIAFELVLFKLFEMQPALPIDTLIDRLEQLRNEIAVSTPSTPVASEPVQPKDQDPALTQNSSEAPSPRAAMAADSLDDTWQALLEAVYAKNPALASNFARSALIGATPEALEIEINGNDYNLKRIKRPENIKAFKRICRSFFGREMAVKFKSAARPPRTGGKPKQRNQQQRQAALNHPLVTEALEIFDGQVVDVKILKEDEE